ncbi:GL16436 [Drosophila persimilis]|uniref:GL16436 n=1 Tax=Drosophila persimilis TaxID=7234 RepID=B4GWI2_DROPE|nr:mitochondrial import receptor subunit TOM70 [Drosophila persimilis]EDW27066.1 GL16436 [Drosophila persimilis]
MPLFDATVKWKLAFFIGTPVVIGILKFCYEHVASKGTTSEKKKEEQEQEQEQNQSVDELEVSAELKDNEFCETNPKPDTRVHLAALRSANDYKNEGSRCYRDRKYLEAIKFYGMAIDTCPEQRPAELAMYYQKRADCYEKLENWSMVKEDCSNALEHDHRYAQAYYCRARAHEATGDLKDCLIDITASCIIEMSMNDDLNKFLERVLMKTARIDAEWKVYSQAPLFANKFDILSFTRSFATDEMMNGSSDAPPPRGFHRALSAFHKEQFADVIPSCTEEIDSSEADYKMEALLMRGTFQLFRGACEEGKQDVDAVLQKIHANVQLRISTYLWSAVLQVLLGKKEEGLEILEQAEKWHPNNADLFYQRALLLCDMERFHEAFWDFSQASQLAPRNATTELQKHFTEYRIAVREENQLGIQIAIKELQESIASFPPCADGYSMMAQVRVDQKDFAEAMKCLQKAVKLNPSNATLLVQKAMLEEHWHGDLKKVAMMLKAAISVDPQCYLAHWKLGLVHLMLRNLTKAVGNFEKACFLAKDNDELMQSYKFRNATVAKMGAFQRLRIVKDDPLLLADLGVPGSQRLVLL